MIYMINILCPQRFFMNKEFYKAGGPVFLMIGGEGAISSKWMGEGAWIHYAKEHNAYCFQLEHRYYGASRPTPTTTTAELKYLSSEQALADLANFIVAMRAEHNLVDAKWISFGGSYPGSLSAWLRKDYPHLVHGSISSSGPLLAEADFIEYLDVVEQSLKTHSDTCLQAVKRSISHVEILLRDVMGQGSITQKFKLCDPIEERISNELDVSNLFESFSDIFAGIVQYSGDPKSLFGIDDACTVMLNTTIGTPIDRMAKINDIILEQQSEKCLDYVYDKMIKDLQNVSYDNSVGGESQCLNRM